MWLISLENRLGQYRLLPPVFLEEKGRQNIWEEADVLLSRIFLEITTAYYLDTFILKGETTPSPMSIPKVNALLSQLDETTDVTQRGVIGQKIMSLATGGLCNHPPKPPFSIFPFTLRNPV